MTSAPILTFKRQGLAFLPADRVTREALADIADGGTMFAQRRNPRNMNQHKRFFAMLENVVQSGARHPRANMAWPSVDSLWFDLSVELKCGVAEVSPRSGKARWEPLSRAVSAMPKEQFEQLERDVVGVLCEWLGCHPSDLRETPA